MVDINFETRYMYEGALDFDSIERVKPGYSIHWEGVTANTHPPRGHPLI